MKMKNKIYFKRFGGDFVDNEIDYIMEYLGDKSGNYSVPSDVTISVGCDSKNKRRKTQYAITIVFYDNFKHNGAHCIFKRINIPKYLAARGYKFDQWYKENKPDNSKLISSGSNEAIFNRLYTEGLYLLELALYLDEKLKGKYFKDHELNEYDGSMPYRLPVLHVDFNSDDGNGRNKSNKVYKAMMGMLCGYGFKVECKPKAYASTSAADLLCKN